MPSTQYKTGVSRCPLHCLLLIHWIGYVPPKDLQIGETTKKKPSEVPVQRASPQREKGMCSSLKESNTIRRALFALPEYLGVVAHNPHGSSQPFLSPVATSLSQATRSHHSTCLHEPNHSWYLIKVNTQCFYFVTNLCHLV